MAQVFFAEVLWICTSVTSGDATSQMDFRRGSLPSVVATVVARCTPTVSAVASFSTQRVSRRPSGSRSEEGQREGFWSSQGCWQRFPPAGATPQCNGTLISCSSETTRSNVSRSSCRGNPIQSRQTQASARHVGRRGRHVPCRSGSTFEGRVPSTRTTCVRAHPVDKKCFVERKQKRFEQAKEATEGAREALNSSMASQREEKNLLTEGERRLAELMMEEKAIPSPFQVTPVCNVNVELDHLRAEIARLRQQQDGIRPVVASVEANHIPVERQELESWMNHRAGDLRVAIEENNGARRLQLITLLAEGQRRLHPLEEEDALFGGRFLCNGTWRGTVRPALRAVRVVGSRYGLRGIRVGEKLLTPVPRQVPRDGTHHRTRSLSTGCVKSGLEWQMSVTHRHLHTWTLWT